LSREADQECLDQFERGGCALDRIRPPYCACDRAATTCWGAGQNRLRRGSAAGRRTRL